jgi:hypothetical protein
MRVSRATIAASAVALGLAASSGCAHNDISTVAVTHSQPSTAMAPPARDKNGDQLPQLRWNSGHQLILTTWGSGTCPSLPTSVSMQSDQRIVIGLASNYGRDDVGCTADLSPTDSVILAPSGLDASKPAVAAIQGRQVTLAPRR